MDLAVIRGWLVDDGWPVEDVSPTALRLRFRAAGRVLPLFVHTDGEFVRLAVVPFARLPADPSRAEAFAKRLLELNREIHFAKFSADANGDVILSVEYRLTHLDWSEVRDAVDVLSFCAEQHAAVVSEFAVRD